MDDGQMVKALPWNVGIHTVYTISHFFTSPLVDFLGLHLFPILPTLLQFLHIPKDMLSKATFPLATLSSVHHNCTKGNYIYARLQETAERTRFNDIDSELSYITTIIPFEIPY